MAKCEKVRWTFARPEVWIADATKLRWVRNARSISQGNLSDYQLVVSMKVSGPQDVVENFSKGKYRDKALFE